MPEPLDSPPAPLDRPDTRYPGLGGGAEAQDLSFARDTHTKKSLAPALLRI